MSSDVVLVTAANAADALIDAEGLVRGRSASDLVFGHAWPGPVRIFTIPNPCAVFSTPEIALRWFVIAKYGHSAGVRLDVQPDSLSAFAGHEGLHAMFNPATSQGHPATVSSALDQHSVETSQAGSSTNAPQNVHPLPVVGTGTAPLQLGGAA